MDGLRWLLLFVGLLVIAGVYLYSRREPKKPVVGPAEAERQEPVLVATDQIDADADAADEMEFALDVESEPAESVPQKIVTLRLVARDGGSFQGGELILNMRGIGLRHGKFGIYHRYDGADESSTIFSAASLVEPGSFDIDNIKEQKIPGISLFMVLPGPLDGVEAFDLMIAAAHALGNSLNGELLDETGSTLSIQRERYMREEIIQYQTSNMVG